jgi:hypothetical protein
MAEGGVLINSLPKSGTHLLERALELLGLRNWEATRPLVRRVGDRLGLTSPAFLDTRSAAAWHRARMRLSGADTRSAGGVPVGVFAPRSLDKAALARWLAPRAPGSFVKAHIPYHPATAELMTKAGLRSVTIIRDPRAVVASMVPFVLDAGGWRHFLQDRFAALCPEQRVDLVINGGETGLSGLTLLPLKQAFESVLDWDTHPGTLLVRFEGLVGPRGGGSAAAQSATLQAIAAHLGCQLTKDRRARMAGVFDTTAPTFRGGQVAGWRARLTPDQANRVMAAIGSELLSRAGYEAPDG